MSNNTWHYIKEAPTGPGVDYDVEVTPDGIKLNDYKNFYLDQKIPSENIKQETIAEIIVKVKEFLNKQSNHIYQGDYKSFRDELIPIILEVVPNLGNSNAGYCSRKIQDYLTANKIIVDERDGFKIEKPIKTVDAVKVLAPILNKVIESIPKTSEVPKNANKQDNIGKPNFNVTTRYEKYTEEFDESQLTPDELEALDIISDDDTGTLIIQKLVNKRSFKDKSTQDVYNVIQSLIQKHALAPVGSYNFNVTPDDLPSYTEHKRTHKTLGDSYIMKSDDDILMMEAYLTESVFNNMKDKLVSKFSTLAPNAAAAAKGNVQATQLQQQLYRSFLQQLGLAGYNNNNVPGAFLVSWLANHYDQGILHLPEAQNINNNKSVIGLQQSFNNLLQSNFRAQYGVSNTPQSTPATVPGAPQLPANQPPALATPKASKNIPSFGIPNQEYKVLLAAITNAKDERAKTRAINTFMKKFSNNIASTVKQPVP